MAVEGADCFVQATSDFVGAGSFILANASPTGSRFNLLAMDEVELQPVRRERPRNNVPESPSIGPA
jgi:hypothetical protein